MGFDQLMPGPGLRPAVATMARCTIVAAPGRRVHLAASVAGPVHAALHRPTRAPDIALFTRDTAGVAGGDTCCTAISVGENASIIVSDTGPTNVLPSRDNRSGRQTTDLDLAAGARAVLLPHAVVPFGESRFLTTTRVHLAPWATAVVGGVLSPGRVARGERWAPALFDQRMEICVGDELIAHDALRVDRSCAPPAGHLVSLFAYSEGLVAALDRVRLAAGIGSGVSAVTDNLLVLRAITNSCSDGYALLRNVVTAVLPDLVGWEWSRIGYDR